MTDIQANRLRRKLVQRDRRIAGMARRIAELESALAYKDLLIARPLRPMDVHMAVQRALRDAGMPPVYV